MMNFWKTHYVPNNASLVVAGNIPLDDLKALAESKFGAWKGGDASRVRRSARRKRPKRKSSSWIVPARSRRWCACCSWVWAAHTPDYPALEVMNSELGGLFSSRINLNLREEHGYTYGANSVFVYRRSQGYFLAGGGIRTDATGAGGDGNPQGNSPNDRYADEGGGIEPWPRIRNRGRCPECLRPAARQPERFSQIFLYNLLRDYFEKLPDGFPRSRPKMPKQSPKNICIPTR